MKNVINAAAAFYTPRGIVAERIEKGSLACYRVESDENTYKLYVTSEYKPAGVAARLAVDVELGDTVFMNGFQSATESSEYNIVDKMSGITGVSDYMRRKYTASLGGDYAFVPYKNKHGVMHGFSYCYFRHGDKVRLFASLDESAGYTLFRFDAWTCTLRVSRDIEGVEKFDNYSAISLFSAEGSVDEVFDAWFKALGEKQTIPAEPLVGYSTKKMPVVDEDDLYDALDSMSAFPVKANVFLIESEYCTHGDWLSPDKRLLPVGFKTFIHDAHEKGLMVGLTVSPFTVSEQSRVFLDHKSWLQRGKDGAYLRTGKSLYILDSANPDVREYVREVIHTVLYMWGYDLVKLDNLYAAAMMPSRGKSRGEKMCSAMDFLRECCGGKLLYADKVPLMPAFGKADYCSVSCEAVADNIPTMLGGRLFRESASVRNASSDILFRRELDKRAFMSAPCTISLDEKEAMSDGNLNDAEQNLLYTLEGLFTSVLMTTDNVALYNQKKKRRFRKIASLRAATDVKVRKSGDRQLVSYKMGEKSYLVKM